ncbi:MAG: hypothetical protein PHN72_06180 [Bacilli bacterium]|nr:hypothetical protein [Bacilli bacterium]
MLKEGSVIELLDHSQYLILSKIKIEDKVYVLLMNKNDISDVRVCFVQGDDITEMEDKNQIENLLLRFLKKTQIKDKE